MSGAWPGTTLGCPPPSTRETRVTSSDVREVIGILGGTGPQGRGLAARWARAGHVVHVGSRTQEKAQAAVDDVLERTGDGVEVHAATNDRVATVAEIVVVALPFEAQAAALPPLADSLCRQGRLQRGQPDGLRRPRPEGRPRRRRLGRRGVPGPDARGPGGLAPSTTCPADACCAWTSAIDTHVLICGDDQEACHRVAHLANRIDGMWGVYCGPLRMSEYVENITPLILTINKLYKIQAGLLIDGIERDPDSLHAHLARRVGSRGASRVGLTGGQALSRSRCTRAR